MNGVYFSVKISLDFKNYLKYNMQNAMYLDPALIDIEISQSEMKVKYIQDSSSISIDLISNYLTYIGPDYLGYDFEKSNDLIDSGTLLSIMGLSYDDEVLLEEFKVLEY